MKDKIDYLWYACYGSNLLEERFRCYISGGTPPGALRTYVGCTDTNPPRASKKISIPAELYFARRSKTWSGGGAAFLKPELDATKVALGRMYLITAEQFAELVKQEIRFEGELPIDLNQAIKDSTLDLQRPDSWYNNLLCLGTDDGIPIFTFTNLKFLDSEINPPHKHYLKIIIAGLKETWNLSPEEITDYLRTKKGIVGTEMEHLLPEMVR